jgi:hypothetical protein
MISPNSRQNTFRIYLLLHRSTSIVSTRKRSTFHLLRTLQRIATRTEKLRTVLKHLVLTLHRTDWQRLLPQTYQLQTLSLPTQPSYLSLPRNFWCTSRDRQASSSCGESNIRIWDSVIRRFANQWGDYHQEVRSSIIWGCFDHGWSNLSATRLQSWWHCHQSHSQNSRPYRLFFAEHSKPIQWQHGFQY